MDDTSLVAAMVAGDPRGLDGAYRRYAPRLYAYCRSILRDADLAADAVQDTFVVAGRRAGQLREPERLLPWLYAIARHECLRQLRDRRRETPAELDDTTADTADLGAGLRAAEARELVHAAAAGLGAGDREVIELALRHGMSAVDIGAVLGISANHAHARLSRARAQLERALGVLLVARAGACPTLRELVAGWDGRLDPLLRKRLGRHVDGCARCLASRGALLSPAALLSGYVAAPFAALPVPAWRPGEAPEIRLDRDGFPATRRRGTWAVAGAAAAVVAVLVVIALTRPGEPDPAPALAGGTPTPAPSTTPTAAALGGSPGPVAVAPTASDPAPPGPSTPEPPAPEPPGSGITITVSGGVRCGSDGFSYTLSVEAVANREMTAARLYWRGADSGTESAAMTATGPSSARGSRAALRHPRVVWWVRGTAADGTTGESPRATSANPCRVGGPSGFTVRTTAPASPGRTAPRPGRPGAPTGPGRAACCCRSRPSAAPGRRAARRGRASGGAAG
ncbi:RNA polymerase sigma factor [Phytohabitans kaempferiae]|uniref:RNA polymerase sigma factor n=1 Tax=Phytohabitans kaempferiae TaxID=1620943 RepID=A0ABV6M9E1_9ACTN